MECQTVGELAEDQCQAGTGGEGDSRLTGSGPTLLMLYNRSLVGPDHHPGRLERVVSQPQLPDNASIVTVVCVHREIFPIKVGLEAAEDKR